MAENRFRLVVLVSGGGTNLQAIMDRIDDGSLPGVEIAAVISNNADAYALERARLRGIAASCISPKDYMDRAAYEKALLAALLEIAPELIVLAGFLVVLPKSVIAAFPNRIINIHPSLIPSFCGKGYYGLHVHEAALARGVKVTGATVHFVDEGTDTGPILMQKPVMVHEDDTPERLQKRVMEEAEWVILPETIRHLSQQARDAAEAAS